MKFLRPALSAAVLTATIACTPLAPSVHKSVIRGGETGGVEPGALPTSQSLKSLFPESGGIPLETLWVDDDDSLGVALGSANESHRLSTDAIKELRSLEAGKPMALSVPAHPKADDQATLRVVIRYEPLNSCLEDAGQIESSAWAFWLDAASGRVSAAHDSSRSKLASCIVNIYLVVERPDRAAR